MSSFSQLSDAVRLTVLRLQLALPFNFGIEFPRFVPIACHPSAFAEFKANPAFVL